MTFEQSVRTCLSKYADFSGTASKSEYWWFALFVLLTGAGASAMSPNYGTVFFIVTLLPLLAAGTRRLRETGRSGWVQLIALVPVAGVFILAIYLAQDGRTVVASEVAAPDDAVGA